MSITDPTPAREPQSASAPNVSRLLAKAEHERAEHAGAPGFSVSRYGRSNAIVTYEPRDTDVDRRTAEKGTHLTAMTASLEAAGFTVERRNSITFGDSILVIGKGA